MAIAETPQVEIPRQFVKDGPPSHWEQGWKEALEGVREFLTPRQVTDLDSAAAGRAIGVYDYGVEWGLGHLAEVEAEAPGYVKIAGLKAALARILTVLAELEDELQ